MFQLNALATAAPVLAAALLLGGCASTAERPRLARAESTVAEAASQPLKDLSLVREAPAAVLEAALADPYRAPEPRTCTGVAEEIVALQGALGPDFDEPGYQESQKRDVAQELASGAVKDLVGLPYRGIIRRVTGADERDRQRQRATLAGHVRRGYLKGLAASMGCLLQPTPTAPSG